MTALATSDALALTRAAMRKTAGVYVRTEFVVDRFLYTVMQGWQTHYMTSDETRAEQVADELTGDLFDAGLVGEIDL